MSKQGLAPQCTNGVRGRLGAPVWFTQLGAGGWSGRQRLWVHLVTCEGVKTQVTQPPCHLLQPQSLICFWLHLVFLSPHHLLTFLALMSELTTCSQNSKVLVPKPATLQTGLKGSPSHLTQSSPFPCSMSWRRRANKQLGVWGPFLRPHTQQELARAPGSQLLRTHPVFPWGQQLSALV